MESPRESERQERIRLFAAALIRYYNFPDESDAQREQWELRKRLDAGEPVDDSMLRPIAERAQEEQLRDTFRQLYGEERANEMIQFRRELLASQEPT